MMKRRILIIALWLLASSARSEDWQFYPLTTDTVHVQTGHVYEIVVTAWQRQDVSGLPRFTWTIDSVQQTGVTPVVDVHPVTGDPVTNYVQQFANFSDVDLFPPYVIAGRNDAPGKGPLSAFAHALRSSLTFADNRLDVDDFVDITQMSGTTSDQFHEWNVSNLVNFAGGIGGPNFVGGSVGEDFFDETRGYFEYSHSITGLFQSLIYDGAAWQVLDTSGGLRGWGAADLPMWRIFDEQLGSFPNMSFPYIVVTHDGDTATVKNVSLRIDDVFGPDEFVTLDYDGDPVQLTKLYYQSFISVGGIQLDVVFSTDSGQPSTNDQVVMIYRDISLYAPFPFLPPVLTTNFFMDYFRVLDGMRWTHAPVVWSAEGEDNNREGSGSGGNWNSAENVTENSFDNFVPNTVNGVPRHRTNRGLEFNASAQTRYAYATASGIAPGIDLPRVYELWARSVAFDTFTDNGSIAFAQAEEWTKLFTSPVTTAGGITSSAIGSFSLAIGAFGPENENTTHGWEIDDARWLIKWDQPGSDFIFKP